MNDLLCFILACSTSIIHSQELAPTASSETGIGDVGCIYFGRLAQDCNASTDTPIESLPSSCSFYVLNKIFVDWSYDVQDTFSDVGSGNILDVFLKAGKKVFLNYGYISVLQWIVVLACNGVDGMNARDEMVGLNAYLDSHKGVTGLLLRHLEPDETYVGIPGLTDGLKTYLGVVREHFSELKIGLSFDANLFMDYYTDPKLEWLNFEELDSLVDLYVISLVFFNMECTADLKCTGSVPMNGNAKYTLEKLKGIIEKSKISRNKIYYLYNLQPSEGDIMMNSVCTITYDKMCKDPEASKNWCADSTKTFYEKGVYSKENGHGVIGDIVDLDDPYCTCDCLIPFPGFQALVDGFKGNPIPKSCPLYDRN